METIERPGAGLPTPGRPGRRAWAFDANNYGGGSLLLWIYAGDAATLYQDTSAATPVTADGHSVGRVANKAAGMDAVYAIQATTGNKPVLKLGVASDGGNAIRTDGLTQGLGIYDASGINRSSYTNFAVFRFIGGKSPFGMGGVGNTRGTYAITETRDANSGNSKDTVDVAHGWGDDMRATLTNIAAYTGEGGHSGWHVWAWRTGPSGKSASIKMWDKGVAAAMSNPGGGADTGQSTRLGSTTHPNTGWIGGSGQFGSGYNASIDLVDRIAYSGHLSDADIETLSAALVAARGVPAS
jgi:hypothetical protein